MTARTRRFVILGGAAALAAGAAIYRRTATSSSNPPSAEESEPVEWETLSQSPQITVPTPDGARLAVWDIGDPEASTVVLPHCWGCTHAIWIPVARRLVEAGYRVVLYDQRGHGATTRGTVPLDLVTLANDLAFVLKTRNVSEAVLAGHSMGGMTIMALATYRPEVLARQARAIILVATAAANMSVGTAQADRLAARVMGSEFLSRSMRSSRGHHFVRGTFGHEALPSHVDLTRTLFADCDPSVRAGFMRSMSSMNLLEGIASIAMPTTVIIGSRDRLTPPARSQQMVSAIPGAHLVTLERRGHMLPLEDPDAVTDEIIRSAKG